MSASESWSAQREDLALEALRRSGRLPLQVHGESMLPTLWPGDVAEIAAFSLNDVGPGDIVLAFRQGRFFLHRFLARRGDEGFVTRGDSMPGPDPAFPIDALLGKVVSVTRGGQVVSGRTRRLSRTLGLLVCHCSLARRAALTFHSYRNSRRPPVARMEIA